MKRPLTDLTSQGWVLLLAVAGLSAIGVMCIHAAPPRAPRSADLRQALFVVTAVLVAVMMLRIGYQPIGPMAYGLFAASLVLLVLLLVAKQLGGLPLIRETNHTYRWINLGRFKLQPSEVMKVGYILALAWYLKDKDNVRRLRGLIGPFALTVLPTMMVLLQPDLGTALLMMPVLFVMLYAAGARLRHLLTVIILGVLCVPVFWGQMKPYQKLRVAGVLLQYEPIRQSIAEDPESPWSWLCPPQAAKSWQQDEGYQLIGSMTALGSGGWLGKGWKRGTYVQFDFLPARHNDFIFAIIGEQFGFFGCLTVLSCYLLIIIAGLEIALATTEPFGKLLAAGVVALISTQVMINAGMTMGLTPITGVTLPFVSYGGSSMLVNYLLVALLISVSQHRPFSLARRPFESAGAEHASVG